MDLTHDTGRSGLGGERRLFAARLITGLIQGVALYALYFAGEHGLWPRTQPATFGALALAAGFAPVVVLAGVGRLSPRTLAIWTAAAALVLALLGWHDVNRRVLESWVQPPFLSCSLVRPKRRSRPSYQRRASFKSSSPKSGQSASVK